MSNICGYCYAAFNGTKGKNIHERTCQMKRLHQEELMRKKRKQVTKEVLSSVVIGDQSSGKSSLIVLIN